MAEPDHEAIIIGAGVCGIYQLYRLKELGVDATVLEAGDDLGGTWYWNKYPGARFDSESISYGYSFSKELLQEWDWKERFSGQPENHRYLSYVAEKFDLRRHMQFGVTVESAVWDDDANQWRLHLDDGRDVSSRFLITAVGLLSAPTMPRYEGMESFTGRSFHTYEWPDDVDLRGKRVAVIGTGATAVQVIGAIAGDVGELTVFQRRPNWCAPLHNAEITPDEMADIKARYDEIFDLCARTPGGFIHEPDRRPFFEVPREERLAKWEQLYGEPGFGIWLANFRDTFMDEEANAELSEFIASKIRSRVHDPAVAEKLIPTDHGFGVQRVPMETGYYEAYNQDNVHLVDLRETPISRITPAGIETSDGTEREFDIIVYATGFLAVTGAYDRIDIRGVGGQRLTDLWAGSPVTFLGLTAPGFPNMLMPTGPQSGSASTNFPRGIELGVGWVTDLMQYMWKHDYTRVDATPDAAQDWGGYVAKLYEMMLMRKAQGWFTGYNSNVEGHEKGTIRYVVFNGGTPKYRQKIAEVADDSYRGLVLS